jgi:large subunit ribosomal protein L36e
VLSWISAEQHIFSCLFCVDVDIRYGLNHGRPTTAIPKVAKPSHRKGAASQKTVFVRNIVREVVGFSPYERRVMELLRNSKVRPWLA